MLFSRSWYRERSTDINEHSGSSKTSFWHNVDIDVHDTIIRKYTQEESQETEEEEEETETPTKIDNYFHNDFYARNNDFYTSNNNRTMVDNITMALGGGKILRSTLAKGHTWGNPEPRKSELRWYRLEIALTDIQRTHYSIYTKEQSRNS